MNILDLLLKEEQKLFIKKSFKKGDVIFKENDCCTSIGYVLYGNIEIISYSFLGKEIIFNKLSQGDIFGQNLLFSENNQYKGDIVCIKDSTILFLNKKNILFLMKTNEDFLNEFLRIESAFCRQLNSTIKMLSFTTAKERINYYFYTNNGIIEYNSISSLARELCLQRETLSRLISELEKNHKIIRERRRLIQIKN